MASAMISDGFTLDGVVKANRGLYPEVRFKYRPAYPGDVYEYWASMKDGGKIRLKATVKVLTRCLVSWDIEVPETRPDGSPGTRKVPITEESLNRVYVDVLETMMQFVMGYSVEEQEEDEKN